MVSIRKTGLGFSRDTAAVDDQQKERINHHPRLHLCFTAKSCINVSCVDMRLFFVSLMILESKESLVVG